MAGTGLYFGNLAYVRAGDKGIVNLAGLFSGPSGPAHTISTPPTRLASFTRSPSLEKAMDASALRAVVVQGSSGQASDVQAAVYTSGNIANQQVFLFVGGDLANASAAASLASYEKAYPTAKVVPAGTLGGEGACATTTSHGESVSMCVWFDNDTFGTLVSPTMTIAMLATTMVTVRPGIEHLAK